MITNRDIAVWAGSAPSVGIAQEEFWGVLQLCDRVVLPFENEALLKVRSVTIDDWRDDGARAAEPHSEVTVERAGVEPLETTCRRYFAERRFGLNISAELVTLEGSTLIREGDGSTTELTGAISIQGMLTGRNTIWIRTRSDAWLPRGLLGDEQPERYALNAPRLRRALVQASAALGGVLSPEPSKLAVVVGFDIENLPVPTVRGLLDS